MHYQNPHAPGCPWYEITEEQGAPNLKWCEETLCQWVSEPANTWSNLGYLTAGIYILYQGIKNRHHFNLKIFGPIIFFMGAMSFIYHQSNFYGSQILDFIGMFFFVSWAIGMNLIRLEKVKSEFLTPFILGYSLLSTGILHWMYLNKIKFQMLILISGVIVFITELLAQKKIKTQMTWFWSTIGILIVALGFSLLDGQRLWCSPENHGWFSQGHALWHWISAVGMVTIFKHYSQDKINLNFF